MAHGNFVKVVIATGVLLSTLVIDVEGASFKSENVVRQIGKDLLNVPDDIQQQWQLKTAIPSYLQDFLAAIRSPSEDNNSPFGEEARQQRQNEHCNNKDFFDKLFDGVSGDSCKVHVTEWFVRTCPENMENLLTNKWVLPMADAWGKFPDGVLSGHVNSYGDFHECVQIDVKNLQILNEYYPKDKIENSFGGQYCTSYLVDYATAMNYTPKPVPNPNAFEESYVARSNSTVQESVSLIEFFMMSGQISFMPLLPSVGVCLPNSCSDSEVQQILVNGVALLRIKQPNLPNYWPLAINCVDGNKPSLDAAAITVIIVLAILVTLAVVTGILDYWGVLISSEKTVYKYLLAFSFYTNTKKWLSTRKTADDLGCLHGIRFLSTAWVVLAHTYYVFVSGPQWNTIDVRHIYKNWSVLAVINGTFSVDTFFVMSGMLAAFNILKMLDKTKGKFNVIMFYIHRYVRLTPTYMILVGIAATLVSYMGNGPFWVGMDMGEDYCRKNWWTNMLYVNNLVNSAEMCNGESWYLANDMQFYILSPLIVYPIWKWETMGVMLLSIYTILSCVAQVLVVRYSNAPPALTVSGSFMALNPTEIYFRPWSRISPFLVGIWLGWLLHKSRGKRLRLPRLLVLALWTCSTGIALAVLFGIADWFDPTYKVSKTAGYFYAGLSRFSWGIAIAWVIFACIKGYGGVIDRFLSWKVFMPLGRLCFCVYLTSIHLQTLFVARLAVPIKYDTYNLVNLFFGHMVMSFLVAFFCSLLFESPFIILQKLLFDGVGQPAKKKTPSDTNVIISDSNSGTDQTDKPSSS